MLFEYLKDESTINTIEAISKALPIPKLHIQYMMMNLRKRGFLKIVEELYNNKPGANPCVYLLTKEVDIELTAKQYIIKLLQTGQILSMKKIADYVNSKGFKMSIGNVYVAISALIKEGDVLVHKKNNSKRKLYSWRTFKKGNNSRGAKNER